MQNILKSVQEYQKSILYSEIEVSIGRSLKKAKGEKKEEKEEKEKKLFMAFRGKAINIVQALITKTMDTTSVLIPGVHLM